MNEPPFPLAAGSTYRVWKPAGWFPLPGRDLAWFAPKLPPGAFDHQIGRQVPVMLNGRLAARARIAAADVAPDGSGCAFTMEITEITGETA